MHKQKGLTMVSWIVVISFFGVVAVAALNIIPSYLSFYSARSIMETLKTDSIVSGKTPLQIRGIITKRFGSNNIRNIKASKDISFKNRGVSEGSSFTVVLDYEDRGKIMGNLYFVTVFHHEVEIAP